MYNKLPRVVIIGDTGDGKTTVMTALAMFYHAQGRKIFSNYTLIGIPYTYLDPNDIASLMFQEDSPLKHCVILTDEAHMDLGKFSFFEKKVRDIGDFATQTRKRDIIWLYTTQVFRNLCKTIRDLTTNFIYCSQVDEDIYKIEMYNRSINNNGYIKTLFLKGAPYYKHFDTGEIIRKTMDKPDEPIKKMNKTKNSP